MSKPKTIKIDDVEYVRADEAVPKPGRVDEDGNEYAIVRSRDQGVMCGYVVNIDGRRVTLKQARQIYRYSSRFVLTDIAEFGLTTKFESKLSCAMSRDVEMLEACGVLYCTDVGAHSLIECPAQNCDD